MKANILKIVFKTALVLVFTCIALVLVFTCIYWGAIVNQFFLPQITKSLHKNTVGILLLSAQHMIMVILCGMYRHVSSYKN